MKPFVNLRFSSPAFVLLILSFVLVSCKKETESSDPLLSTVSSNQPTNSRTKIDGCEILCLSSDAQKSIGMQIAKAQERLLDFSVNTTGEVLANANLVRHVHAPVTGRVMEVLASVGQHVSEGQPLCLVRSQDIGQAESDLLQNEAEVRADLKRDLLQVDSDTSQANAQLKLSESTYQRINSLVQERIASRAEFEAARTQNEKDKITVETLKRKRDSIISLSQERLVLLTEPIKQKLRLLGVSDQEIDKVLKMRQINPVVPIVALESGIVSERLINVGELTDPSQPIFTIGDFHNVWLKADVYEKDIAKVREDQPIELAVDSFPGEKFRGTLDYVSDSVNADTRTLTVRAEVANPGLKLKPKMFARMTILVGKHQVLSIPKSAVQDAGSDKVVYIPHGDSRYEERKVVLGSEAGDYVEVISGLTEDMPIVTKGSFELRSESLKASD